MIATAGYDGFLYSVGYLAGWIVALFIVAEPLKRLGKYTFTDALDANYQSPRASSSSRPSALCSFRSAISSRRWSEPGVLVTPLLGLPHFVGVIMVGLIVITIVATAGMTSTTYVQFIKGAMLIVFSVVVVAVVLFRGLSTTPDQGGRVPFRSVRSLDALEKEGAVVPSDPAYTVTSSASVKTLRFVKLTGPEGKAGGRSRPPPKAA